MVALANSKVQYVSSAKWASVAAYPSAGSVAAGVLCTNTANSPAVGSERVFVSTAGGVTLGTAPTFTTTKGAITEDAATTLYWQECTGQPGVNGDITNSPIWVASATVVLGQIIYDSGTGSLQIANQGFTASASTPTFSATAGTTSTGQDVGKWTSLGLASAFGKFAAPHARILNADAATWQTVVPAQIFIDSNHAETTSAAGVSLLGGQGVASTPNQYLSVSASGSIPPTSCTAGASVNTTGANNIAVRLFGYYYGISFLPGSAGNTANILIGNTGAESHALYLDNCTFNLNNTSTSSVMTLGVNGGNSVKDSLIWFNNPAFIFGSTSQKFNIGSGYITSVGGAFASTGSALTTAFTISAVGDVVGITTFRDLDISKITGTLCAVTASPVVFNMQNCKLGASVTMTSGSFVGPGGAAFRLHNCDSGSKNYRFYDSSYLGSNTQETTIVRTGGATDGVTPISWNITPAAVALFGQPFTTEYLPIAQYNSLITGSHTATIYITSDAVLTNGNFWAELECLDSSATPIGTIVTSRVADPLTATSGLTVDSTSTWASGKTYNYKIALTFSPAMAGAIKVRLFAATGTTTPIYVDPFVQIDSLQSQRQFLIPGAAYFNTQIQGTTPILQSGIIQGLGAI